jgi:3-hydroxyisobutyrate dehydrogenase
MLKVTRHPDYPPEEGRYVRGNDASPVAVAIILNHDADKIPPEIEILVRAGIESGAALSASVLKVVTNYLCTVHLAALAEAFAVTKKAGMGMNTTYEAIRISSGNSFVHETESQVILNGSRDINFTMDLVVKDVGLFDKLANVYNVPVEISPLVLSIFKDGQERYGPREFSPNIIRRLEEACGIQISGTGFPDEMTDDEPEEPGYEVIPH